MSEEETGKLDSTKDLEVDGSGDAFDPAHEDRIVKTLADVQAQQEADEGEYRKAQELELEKLRLAKEANEKADEKAEANEKQK